MIDFSPRSARPRDRIPRVAKLAALAFALVAVGCSSSNDNGDAGAGGVVTGALDTHCSGVTPIVVDPATCDIPADPNAVEEEAPTLYNAEADDDDCKYHVKWTATPSAKLNQNLTFKVTVTYLSDGTPATGAVNAQGDGVTIEAYLADNETHVRPNTSPLTAASETPASSGVYTITPVKFDASGRWVVRFHLFETCNDGAEETPHGHVAFYFDVP